MISWEGRMELDDHVVHIVQQSPYLYNGSLHPQAPPSFACLMTVRAIIFERNNIHKDRCLLLIPVDIIETKQSFIQMAN